MKRIVFLLGLLLSSSGLFAQKINLDSLMNVAVKRAAQTKPTILHNRDSLFQQLSISKLLPVRIRLVYEIMGYGEDLDKNNLEYHYKIINWAKQTHDDVINAITSAELGFNIGRNGDIADGLKLDINAFKLAQQTGNSQAIAVACDNLTVLYTPTNPNLAKFYAHKALEQSLIAKDYLYACYATSNLGSLYKSEGKLDSANFFYNQNFELAVINNVSNEIPASLLMLGEVQTNKQLQIKYYKLAQIIAEKSIDVNNIRAASSDLADYYTLSNQPDSALLYARKAYAAARVTSVFRKQRSAFLLSQIFRKINVDSALKYADIFYSLKDSTNNLQKIQQANILAFNDQKHQQEAEVQKAAFQARLRYYILSIAIVFLLLLAIVFWRNNQKSKQANILLKKQKDEIDAWAKEAQIEMALEKVRSKSLAMQQSSELPEISALIFQQVKELGVTAIQNSIAVVNEQTGFVELSTTIHGSHVLHTLNVPIDENYVMAKAVTAWKAKHQTLTLKFEGNELKVYNEYRNSFLATKVNFPEDQWIVNISFFSKGWLSFSTDKDVPGELIVVLKRFAAVFEQAYTRFNDLKLAETLAGQAKQDLIKLRVAKKKAEDALTELKATQTQLIQSEKMASLGELTAGIAHEIQNPLNFVNNFSEVSIELLEELKEEAQAGHTEDVIAIATDLTQNLEKINHHGKRADGIVKGMLQHSRASSNTKEPTDINKLADEYLRLAYHGLRAKEKSFNAELVTNFAPNLPKVNMVPQDIGRVLLNLFNNAFYATQQKLKTDVDFKPEVTLTTSANGKEVIITVKDNGNGIPDAIKEKIMQPFFTTKPTGEGTGLGLSLSYDIVVKGHGGKIDVNSKEGEGSEFIIQISTVKTI